MLYKNISIVHTECLDRGEKNVQGKRIFKKGEFSMIVMIGVSLIPALYNVIFWAPCGITYGRVSSASSGCE